jgi:hypothetical protein
LIQCLLDVKGTQVLHRLTVSERRITKNRGIQHLTFGPDAVTFRRLLGSGSGEDGQEEAILIGPPSGTVGVSLPLGR